MKSYVGCGDHDGGDLRGQWIRQNGKRRSRAYFYISRHTRTCVQDSAALTYSSPWVLTSDWEGTNSIQLGILNKILRTKIVWEKKVPRQKTMSPGTPWRESLKLVRTVDFGSHTPGHGQVGWTVNLFLTTIIDGDKACQENFIP